jgi:hypothetical protein
MTIKPACGKHRSDLAIVHGEPPREGTDPRELDVEALIFSRSHSIFHGTQSTKFRFDAVPVVVVDVALQACP